MQTTRQPRFALPSAALAGVVPRLLLLAVAVGNVPLQSAAAELEPVGRSRPSIVFILADDLGYGDLSCYGHPAIRTPELDRLAEQGVRLTNCYANGPECTPTRTALLTGRYQQWVGGLECAIGTGNVGRYDDAVRLAERHDLGLPTEEQTLAALLKQAGYATAITGKWHLGYEPKFAPHLHGFDYALYCLGGGMDYFHYTEPDGLYALYENGKPVQRTGYFTDLATDAAIRFIEQHQAAPFFLYLAYTVPHTPYQGPEDFAPDPLPGDSARWNQSHPFPEVYRAMIEHMDRCIGRVLKAIDECRLGDRCVVIFTSDNGGTRNARNAPFSGDKGSTYEGGIRVPGIVRWPGVIPAGVVSHQPCITFDFTASIARIAGARPSEAKPLEGIDILAHLAEGKPEVPRNLFWRKPRGDTVWKAVRAGDLKFVAVQDGATCEEHLFDLKEDPAEQHDLAAARPADLERLRAMYEVWESVVRRNRRGRE